MGAESREGRGEHRPEVNLGPLDGQVGFHLRIAHGAAFRALKRLTGERNLKPGWYTVLSIIGDNPGVTPMALSRATGRDKSTITPILRDVGRAGLVRREPVSRDRRSYGLHLTEEGERKVAHLAFCAAANEQEITAVVGDRKAELLDLLRRIGTEIE